MPPSSRPARRESFFATCAPGVEPVLQEEMRALRMTKVERQVGGVYFEGTMADARRANLWLRTAVRVLMRVDRFLCPDEKALYDATRETDWSRFLAPDGRMVVDARTNQSSLDHTRFIEQRVKDAVVDQFRERTGTRPSVDRESADLGIYAHLFRDRCTLLVDTSGHALHKRGWRRHQGRAPLAETLAAAIVQLSGWDRRAPLLDPFCGSGTIVIEAALLAERVAPGLFTERFAFEGWPGHDAAGWRREQEQARAERVVSKRVVLAGNDIDPAVVESARENAAAAGVAESIELEVGDARTFEPRRGWNAWIVSNLPYGQRVGRGAQLDELYGRFGAQLREHCVGYTVALFTANDTRSARLGLHGARSVELANGGLDCRLLLQRIEE